MKNSNTSKVTDILQARLTDMLMVYLQSKQVHWNVMGPHFKPLHDLFDTVATFAQASADEIAERAVVLGAPALSGRRHLDQSKLEELPPNTTGGSDCVAALTRILSTVSESLRADINSTAEMGDPISSDILTGIGGELEKTLWMVRSHKDLGTR